MAKDYPTVKANWRLIPEPEFELTVTCPHCRKILDSYNIQKVHYKFQLVYTH